VLVSADAAGGPPHEARLQFAYDGGMVYLLARRGEEWHRNVERDQGVVVRIRQRGFRGRAHLFDPKQRVQAASRISALFRRKYGAGIPSDVDWGVLLPVRIDVQF